MQPGLVFPACWLWSHWDSGSICLSVLILGQFYVAAKCADALPGVTVSHLLSVVHSADVKLQVLDVPELFLLCPCLPRFRKLAFLALPVDL